jgi:hypothetical protein
MFQSLRIITSFAAYMAILSVVAVWSGPRVLAGSELEQFVGAKPDCDSSGMTYPQCPQNPNNPNACPITQTYGECKPDVSGSNDILCQAGGNGCVDPRCNAHATEGTGGGCKRN